MEESDAEKARRELEERQQKIEGARSEDIVQPSARPENNEDDSFVDSDVDFDFVDLTIDEEISSVPQPPAPETSSSENMDITVHSALDDDGDLEFTPVPIEVSPELPENSQEATSTSHTSGELQTVDAAAGKMRIGDRLIQMGLITKEQLNVALQEKRISGRMLGEALVDLGFIDEAQLTIALAESAGFDVFDPKSTIVDGTALELLEKKEAQQLHILPLFIQDNSVYVALVDPYDIVSMDTLRRKMPKGYAIKPMVTTPSVLNDAIDAAYGYSSTIEDILRDLEDVDNIDLSKLTENEAYTHPIVRLVNALLFEAVKLGASDLHFEPEENFVRLRYRLDGVLFTAQVIHKKFWSGISQRIKIMSEMNIADKLSPQDGRFSLNVGGREADFRVSSLPTVNGENIVLRVLDKKANLLPLSNLGFSEHNLSLIQESQKRPEGIIIVTGPTGSGKSTSLYSMLDAINDVEVNIQTLEDPVEYSIPMIRQTSVREGVLGFAEGIKAMLRQDPDIIFIGEVRDATTAGMALKAAMTGHQVYTTLHTNDSFGAIPRLLDLDLKPNMLAGAIVSIFAQRLTRKLCPNCRVEYTPDERESNFLGMKSGEIQNIYKANEEGCSSCNGQGYSGRTAIVEILMFDEDMDDALANGDSKAEIKRIAREKGFKSLRDDAILKIKEGVTSIEAASKVVNLKI